MSFRACFLAIVGIKVYFETRDSAEHIIAKKKMKDEEKFILICCMNLPDQQFINLSKSSLACGCMISERPPQAISGGGEKVNGSSRICLVHRLRKKD